MNDVYLLYMYCLKDLKLGNLEIVFLLLVTYKYLL